jgi:Ca2+-binding RTX toxin-like protein
MGYNFTGTVGGAQVTTTNVQIDTAIIPDFDGDGIPDIILSNAWKPVPGLGNAGVIHIISGAALASLDALDGVLDGIIPFDLLTGSGPGVYTLTGSVSNGYAGDNAIALEDIDGDGLADLLIGSLFGAPAPGFTYEMWAAYVITSSSLADADAADGVVDFQVDLNTAIQQPGNYLLGAGSPSFPTSASIIGTGDLNGDGISDLLVGDVSSPMFYLVNGTTLQALDVASGGATSTISPGAIGSIPGSFKIISDGGLIALDLGGDFNGDGVADLLVVSPINSPTGSGNTIVASLVTLAGLQAADGLDGATDRTVTISNAIGLNGTYGFYGIPAGTFFSAIESLDFSGDGISDIAMGARNSSVVYLIEGTAAALQALDALDGTIDNEVDVSRIAGVGGSYILSGTTFSQFGVALASAGDVDGDGRADLLIGASGLDRSGSSSEDQGGVYLVTMAAVALADGLDGTVDGSVDIVNLPGLAGSYLFVGAGLDHEAGRVISMAGDIDGDGMHDLLVTSLQPSFGTTSLIFSSDFATLDAMDGNVDGVIDLAFATSGLREGTSGNDMIAGGIGSDTLLGLVGNDTIIRGPGNDSIDGGFGNDLILHTDTAGEDTINGGQGDDSMGFRDFDASLSDFTITVSGGETTLSGAGTTSVLMNVEFVIFDEVTLSLDFDAAPGIGADNLLGSSSGEVIDGLDGADTILGQGGADTILGGPGLDLILGGNGDDELRGNLNGDTIHGGGGFDAIYGNFGFDSLYGGTFADTIYGGNQDDQIWGEAGNDSLIGQGDNDTIRGGDGFDTMQGGPGDDLLFGGASGDRLIGGIDNDTLYGEDGADNLYGGDGEDRLYGGAGQDAIYGDAGDDVLFGEGDDDRLFGGSGNDTIDGGSGNDTMFGSSGVDHFVFGIQHGDDVIRDFDPTNEIINLGLQGTLFVELTITDVAGGALVTTVWGTILVEGVQAADLTVDQFVF